MTVNETYKTYLIKVNKNDTNKNIKVSKGLFVKIYNEQSKIWLRDEIRGGSKTYEKNRLSSLLQFDLPLEKGNITTNYVEFKLPSNYFDIASSYSIANKGECKNRVLLNWDFKIKNRNTLFQDENFNPSFEYEETLINLSKGNLIVFKTDFDVVEEFLTYYTKPIDIDIEGYIKEDGTRSQDINPDIEDNFVNEIISLSVLETIRIFENPDSFQLAQDRVNNNKNK